MNEDRYSDLKKIGLRIREIRLGKKMSQADLAVKAHLSLPQISDIERGKSNMMLSTFISIAEALQVSSDSLLRIDIPEVNTLYNTEFKNLLSDCTPDEIDSILKIVTELKTTMHSHKGEYNA